MSTPTPERQGEIEVTIKDLIGEIGEWPQEGYHLTMALNQMLGGLASFLYWLEFYRYGQAMKGGEGE